MKSPGLEWRHPWCPVANSNNTTSNNSRFAERLLCAEPHKKQFTFHRCLWGKHVGTTVASCYVLGHGSLGRVRKLPGPGHSARWQISNGNLFVGPHGSYSGVLSSVASVNNISRSQKGGDELWIQTSKTMFFSKIGWREEGTHLQGTGSLTVVLTPEHPPHLGSPHSYALPGPPEKQALGCGPRIRVS